MCGIAGAFSYRTDAPPIDVEEIIRVRDKMEARGPDGHGLWHDDAKRIVLAHRRLAIIDLTEAGLQPMRDPETGNQIVFNGEIYNYPVLRRELEAAGQRFRSHSDTEVLLKLYAVHGKAMLHKLRGMFAFVIWDARSRQLLLARDPMGIKPLYYSDNGHTIRFASQVKALLASSIAATPCAAGLASFFIFGHVREPWTWVKEIKAVPAGTAITIENDKGIVSIERYFDLHQEILAAQDNPTAAMDATQEALAAVDDSVRAHLVADVPVGLFLSAGRDSTLLGALARRHTAEPLQTVTLGFEEYQGLALDETPVAEAVARRLGFQHETKRITREAFESEYLRILEAMDQPSIDGVNTWFVSRAAAQAGLKVALSGLGGDELFGGYPSFKQVPRLTRRLRALAWLPSLGRAFRIVSDPLIRRFANPKWASLLEYGGTLEGAWLLRRALFMPWELERLMEPEFARQGLQELALLETLRAGIADIRNPQLAVMALEMTGYMRNQLLRDADWAGMAHSLEIRVPLVDSELLRRWLPVAVRNFPLDRQQLLDAADPAVAAIVAARPKTGFSVPVEQWHTTTTPDSLPDLGDRRGRGLRPWACTVADRFAGRPARSNIAVLLTDAYGGIGGIAKFNRDLLRALAQIPSVQAILALPRLLPREKTEPIPDKIQYDLRAARGKWAYMLRLLRRMFKPQRLDLVICGHINLLPLAWLVSSARRCPLLLIVHGVDAWQPHRNPFVRHLLSQVDVIAAVSRYTVERMRAWSALPEQRFRILPNCVDLQTFTMRPRNTMLAQRLALDGRRVLLTVGRLASTERYKGFDEMLEVLPQLVRERADIVYVIAGDGNDRTRLEAKAQSLGMANHVVFTGYLREEEKIDLYNLADVYVMPSRGEGFGIVYLEAMACGVPVIGSMLDGSRDALRDGALGQLVDPRDPPQLVQAIHRALATPRGRPDGIEYFSQRAFDDRAAALVREILKEPT